MKITFTYFAQVRAAAGVETEPVELAGTPRLAEALAGLAERHGPDFRALVLDDAGAVRPSLLVLVNGQPAGGDGGRTLADGDAVSLLSAVAGG
jgi:molybdopterin converting factor small subunit